LNTLQVETNNLLAYSASYINVYTSLLPINDSSYTLGGSSNKWNYVYTNYVQGNTGRFYLSSSGSLRTGTHFDPNSVGSYNCGGSSLYWFYLNCVGVSYHSMGFYDGGVTDRKTGIKLTDLEAIKALKPHPTEKTKYGVPLIDKRSLPIEMFVPAQDHDGTEWERDEDGVPIEIIKDELTGEVTERKKRPDADGEDVGQLTALALGAIKELSSTIDDLKEKVALLEKK
jgi:hypothetical protein